MCKSHTSIKIVLLLSMTIFCVFSVEVTDEEYALMPPVFHLDNYDHCMLLGKDALYCRATIYLSPADRDNTSNVWNTIQIVNQDVKNYNHSYLRHGICIKESCPEILKNISAYTHNVDVLREVITMCYTNKYKDLELKPVVTNIDCMHDHTIVFLGSFELIALLCMLIQICLVIFGTAYDEFSRNKPKSEYQACTQSSKFGKFICCFSLRKNWDRVANTPHADSLQCIEGIRCVCTIFIICCHSCIYQLLGGVLNTRQAENIFHQPMNMLMINIFICQPFFLISAWLLAYNFLKIFDNEKLNIIHIVKYIVNRYIRIMPSFVALLFFAMGMYKFLQPGPNFNHTIGEEIENCKENWWSNILLINNYYGLDRPCFFHTWYLAADTQLYVVALIIITVTWIFKKYMKTIYGVTFLVAMLLPAIFSYVMDYDIVMRLYPEKLFNLLADDDVYNHIHIPGHTNMGASVLGLIFGYVYYKFKKNGTKMLTTKVRVAVWYGVVLIPLIIITPLPIAFFGESYVNVPILTAIHAALARNIFAFCVGLLILGISEGHGWVIRDFLNWAPFQMMGKLCYCTYLIHPILQIFRISQTRAPAFMDVFQMFLHATDDIAPGFVIGTVLCLFVEMPFWALQKTYIPQVKAKKKPQHPKNEENGDIKVYSVTNQNVVRL